jgi:hypothetical protein
VIAWTPEQLSALTPAEKDELWQILAARARLASRESLAAFMEYVFGLEPAPHHRLLIEGLEAIESAKIRRLLVIYPPGHAKSTVTSIIFPTWYLGRHPRDSIAGVTITSTLAKLYDSAIANVIELNEGFRTVFPTVLPQRSRGWSSDGRFLHEQGVSRDPGDKDPQLVFAGAGAGIVGRRADGVLIDDVVDEEISRSDVMLEGRVRWIQSSLLTRLQPAAWRVCVGTLWREGDVVDTLRQTGDWITIIAKAESDAGRQVYAEVELPDDAAWRPTGFEAGE